MAKRGVNVYKRKDGRWEGRYKNGYRADGSAKYSSVYSRSYKEVCEKLAEKKSESRQECCKCSSTFAEIAAKWCDNIKKSVKESTYVNYITKLDKHVLPAFGNWKYDKLTKQHFVDFVEKKLKSQLSPKYVSDILSVVKSITKYARQTFNYADRAETVTVPKNKHAAERPVLTEHQQNTLTAHLLNLPTLTNVGVLLSLYTGIRIGELCALKWSDIDLEKRILTVNRTMQRIKDLSGNSKTKIYIGTPKSRSSLRQIPLPDFLAEILREVKANDDDYVLTGKKLFAEPRTMQYRFAAILKKLKLPKVNFHALRHTFATGCIALGFDAKTLSEILGHSSVEITLNRYVHSSMERKRACMDILNRQISCQ